METYPRLIGISGPLKGMVLPVTEKEITFGRDPSNDVCLEDDLASRRHATARLHNGRTLLTDPRSRNGTMVNNADITSRYLEHGDRVKIAGSLVLHKIRAEGDEVPPDLADAVYDRGRTMRTVRIAR